MAKAKTLSEIELSKLLSYLKTTKNPKRNRLMILLTYWAGMRVGEVAALCVRNVLNEDLTVKEEIILTPEQTKGNRSRTVLLPEKLRIEIENYMNANLLNKSQRDLPLFLPTKGFKEDINVNGFTADSLTHIFMRFYKEAGIDNGSSHSGRRTFITRLASRGVSARVLQELAGHQHLSTTQQYIDINDEMKRKALELL
jgi:integrase/recombinase XerD